jgi:hypothetical protein
MGETNMNDQFLHALRERARPEFAAALLKRLHDQDAAIAANARRRLWVRAGASVGLAAAVVLIAVVPTLRASAQAFFDLFRVTSVEAVPVDVTRLEQLSQAGLDLRDLIGQHVRVTGPPDPPMTFSAPEDAGQAIGAAVHEPQAIPSDLTRMSVQVGGGYTAEVVADGRRLADVLQALGITDISVPDGLDGQTAVIHVPPMLRVEYGNGDRTLTFLQSQSPEVAAPVSLDLARLGEIALRIAGLDARHAHSLAQEIDWRSTFVIPVPAASAIFRDVDVRGQRGVLIESTGSKLTRTLAWTRGGIVYGLVGNVEVQAFFVAAESVPMNE